MTAIPPLIVPFSEDKEPDDLRLPLGGDNLFQRLVRNPHVESAFPKERECTEAQAPFFRQKRQTAEFLRWLDEVGGTSEELPGDAFRGAQVFRHNGARTPLLVIDK